MEKNRAERVSISKESSFSPSNESEISPATKSQKSLSQEPREPPQEYLFLASKEMQMPLTGVPISPAKSTSQKPREIPKEYLFLPSKEIEMEMSLSSALVTDAWIIKKELNDDEIRGYLYLSQAFIESHTLRSLSEDDQKNNLRQGNEMRVNVYDTDTHTTHKMLLKRSKKNQAYYRLKKFWLDDFVDRRSLKKGDEIGLFWDHLHSNFHFRVLSRANADEIKEDPVISGIATGMNVDW